MSINKCGCGCLLSADTVVHNSCFFCLRNYVLWFVVLYYWCIGVFVLFSMCILSYFIFYGLLSEVNLDGWMDGWMDGGMDGWLLLRQLALR